ncbi:MAG: BtrH N-terminal domain-containing protein [bacterium]
MPATIIPGWIHARGKHCASTALSNAMNFWGFPFSESLCAGLGSAPGFYYLKMNGTSPSKLVYTRSHVLEENFFSSLGIPFEWTTHADGENAITGEEKEFIREGVPLFLKVDLKYLEYYRTSTSFAGHIVLNWGYDDDERNVLYGDTHFEGLQSVPYGDASRARHARAFPSSLNGEWVPFRRPAPRPLEEAIPAALKTAVDQNLRTGSHSFGVEGMRSLASEIHTWADAEDWKWCLRFTYQIIEKRGTGGGGFRRLYAQFLEEAARLCPKTVAPGLAERMHKIADRWTELSSALKAASEEEKPSDFSAIAGQLSLIADNEETLFSDIASNLP